MKKILILLGASLRLTSLEKPGFAHSFKLCSVEELKQYSELCWFNEEFFMRHNENFFKEKVLFVTYIGTFSDENIKQILSVNETPTTIEVELETVHPLPSTTGIYDLVLILEMDRDMPEKEIWVNSEKIAEAPYNYNICRCSG